MSETNVNYLLLSLALIVALLVMIVLQIHDLKRTVNTLTDLTAYGKIKESIDDGEDHTNPSLDA